MFIPATNNHINSSINYDYYTLLIIVIVIYFLHINSLYEANKALKKKIEDMELTIKMNTTNIYDKIDKLRQENKEEITKQCCILETYIDKNINNVIEIDERNLNIIKDIIKENKEYVNKTVTKFLEKAGEQIDLIKKLHIRNKEFHIRLKKLTKEVESNQFVMTGTYYYTPLLVYKGTDNLLKSIISNNIENSILLENVEYFNIYLSALVKFKNVKEIELTKIHKYANIIDDDGKMIWSKREDTLSSGYEIVVTYLNENKVKFI